MINKVYPYSDSPEEVFKTLGIDNEDLLNRVVKKLHRKGYTDKAISYGIAKSEVLFPKSASDEKLEEMMMDAVTHYAKTIEQWKKHQFNA